MVVIDGLEDWQLTQLEDAMRRVPTVKYQSFRSPAKGFWRNAEFEEVDIDEIREHSVKHIEGGVWVQSDFNALQIEATMPHLNDQIVKAVKHTVRKED